MILRRIFAAAALLCAIIGAMPAHAQTGTAKTPAQLNAEINALFYDNSIGAVSPFDLRQVTLDQVASSFNYQALCATSGAFPIYNATAAAWECSTVGGSGSTAVLQGSANFYTPNAVFTNSINGATPTLFQMAAGSNANPITSISPTVAISRNEAINGIDTEGGQNAALLVNLLSHNTSAASQSAQGNAIRAYAQQLSGGAGDEVGVYSSCVTATGVRASDSHAFGCFGIFTAAERTTNPATTLGGNFVIQNNSGVDCPYSGISPGGTACADIGLFLQADGTNLQSVGALLFNNSGQFDVGYAAWSGSIKTTTFEDDSSSVTSIKITGSHTTGIDMSAATLSGNAFHSPGFTITPIGGATSTSNFQVGDGTTSGIFGATASFLTDSTVFGTLNATPVGFLYNNALAGSIQSGPAWKLSNSLALNGCTIGSNAFCVTGASAFSGGGLFGGSLGYATGIGAGGAVTQATSRTTGVTINTPTGAITLFSAAGSVTPATFTVTNSSVAATDVIKVVQKSGANLYEIFVTDVTAGAFNVTQFTTGGTTSEAPVFNFTVIKGAAT